MAVTKDPVIINGRDYPDPINWNKQCVFCGALMSYDESTGKVDHRCVTRPPGRPPLISAADREEIDRHRNVLEAIEIQATRYTDIP